MNPLLELQRVTADDAEDLPIPGRGLAHLADTIEAATA
jgi:hypothetical protein